MHEPRVLKDIRRLRRLDERHARNGRLIKLSSIDGRRNHAIDADLRAVRIGNHAQPLRQDGRVIVDDELRAEQIGRHEVLATFVTATGKPPASTGDDRDRLRRRNQCAIDIHPWK